MTPIKATRIQLVGKKENVRILGFVYNPNSQRTHAVCMMDDARLLDIPISDITVDSEVWTSYDRQG